VGEGVEAAFLTVVRQLDLGVRVLGQRALTLGNRQHLLARHEEQIRVGIDEAPNQPGTRDTS
jgi:hypothetical protein